LFFEGLKRIFKKISVPIIESLAENRECIVSMHLPSCKTFAVFDNVFIADPTKKEELSCDSLIHVFFDDFKDIYCINLENSRKLDPLLLTEVINSL
jgi:exosome complex RNA-binding protein Rrp42 (RNase PH superfamily)